MLRPERMSKVSVTGAKRVLDDVIETVHELHLLHLTEYDGAWEGFSPGSSQPGAEDAADKLVTVRSLESILDVDRDEVDPDRIVVDDTLEAELDELRAEVNELDDRRDELRSELRDVEEQIQAATPFVDLGLDLDLLSGYDSLEVAVGEGDPDAIEQALTDAETIDTFESFAGSDIVAVFARPVSDSAGDAVSEALVGVDFSAIDVPRVDDPTDPEGYVSDLRARKRELEADLERVQEELADVRDDAAGFLLAAEEELSITVQKTEAPLSFATTANAFVAEGWIPTEEYDRFAAAIEDAVGDHAEVEELEQAAFGSGGGVEVRQEVPSPPESATPADDSTPAEVPSDAEDETEPEEEPRAVADGGTATGESPVVMRDDDPPVTQDNPGVVRPFEVLTRAVGRPKYTELDPTIVLFLTFPVMFGFMIGDFGYGLIYTLLGAYAYTNWDSDMIQNVGIVTMGAGISTVVFGILYGEIFGLHLITTYLWEGLVGLSHPPIEKGLSPATVEWAEAWFVVTALFGVLHLNIGWVFEFIEDLEFHGPVEAFEESGSWLLALNGLWLFVFSRLFAETKPDLLFTVFNEGEGAAFEFGFAGLPPTVGWIGIGMLAVGIGLLAVGPTYELIEIHQVLAHALSYLRIGAVLLAKAGMAFAVNLLFFGAYVDEGGHFHFLLSKGPDSVPATGELLFGGLLHGGIVSVLVGIVVLLVGHLVVLILGVTSSGIQAIRLEYFEFFSKFYEGTGAEYLPFGHDREFTAEE